MLRSVLVIALSSFGFLGAAHASHFDHAKSSIQDAVYSSDIEAGFNDGAVYDGDGVNVQDVNYRGHRSFRSNRGHNRSFRGNSYRNDYYGKGRSFHGRRSYSKGYYNDNRRFKGRSFKSNSRKFHGKSHSRSRGYYRY